MHTASSPIRSQQLELPPCIHQKDGCGVAENSTAPQNLCWTCGPHRHISTNLLHVYDLFSECAACAGPHLVF